MHTVMIKLTGGNLSLQHPQAKPGDNGHVVTFAVDNVPDNVSMSECLRHVVKLAIYTYPERFDWSAICDLPTGTLIR